MKKIYVTSDIHGYYDYFIKLLKRIKFQDDDFMYILGDAADRGPDGIKVYQHIINSSNMLMIKGNHDEMFLNSILEERNKVDCGSKENWFYNGGKPTYDNFQKLSMDEQDEIILFLKLLPLYREITIEEREFILVHAGINPRCYELPLNKHKPYDLLWIRDKFINGNIKINKTIIAGHTPTWRICDCDKILYKDNKILIDCGAAYKKQLKKGHLGCLRLNDMKEYYI